MAPTTARIRPLLLAGGKSSRMGYPKHLLLRPDGEESYLHTLRLLRSALPSERKVYISIRDGPQRGDFAKALEVDFVSDAEDENSRDIGPAAGLLAAHALDREAHWLVMGCDHPLASVPALQQLIDEYQEPLTCFAAADGFCNPLIAIWSPSALVKLKMNVLAGGTSPMKVVKEIKAKTVQPKDSQWIIGTNTKEEWIDALKILQSEGTNDLS